MERLPGWEKRLQALFDAQHGQPFQWGRTDCAHFAADAVAAITGHDVLGPLRGSYASRLAARARMRARGWRTLADAADGLLRPLGAVPVPPRFARAGDIGLTLDHVLCVRYPVGFVARAGAGTMHVPNNVTRAWAI